MAGTAPPRPYRKGATALAALVPEAVAPALRQRGFATAAILTEWREIVGPRLAQWTSPLEIRWPRKPSEIAAAATKSTLRRQEDRASRATLVIAAPGAFALEVQMAEATIIEAVNRRLGFGCIGAIRIQQAPRAAPEIVKPRSEPDPALIRTIEANLVDVKDADLRAILAILGAEIATKSAQ